MSIIRNKYLRRAGVNNKKQQKKIRLYCKNIVKCNKRYGINNKSFHFGLNDKFIMQST